MPNAPYLNRYASCKERHRTMKEILLVNWKIEGNANPQIAHPDKSVRAIFCQCT